MKAEDLKSYEESMVKVREGASPGPWDTEPNRVEWRSQGFPCLIVRGPKGALCGYVGLPPAHPDHGKHYDSVDVSVHGGLTYAEKCAGVICHAPAAGETEDIWWLGFDCNHSWRLQHYGDEIPLCLSGRYGPRSV